MAYYRSKYQSEGGEEGAADSKGMLLPFGEKAHKFAYTHPRYDARITILEGAVRSGKTWALMVKIVNLCVYKVKGRRLLIGYSRQSIVNNVLTDLREFVGEENFHLNQSTGELMLCGTRWWCVGARDIASEKRIRGLTVGIAVVDELTLIPESFWDMLISRLSPAGARAYGSTNPDHPKHYLKRKYIDNKPLRHSGMLNVLHFTLQDNPNLDYQYRLSLIRSHKGVFFRRFVLGEWIAGEGAIYASSFDDKNLFEDATTPVGLYGAGGYQARYVSIDYGTRNPFAAAEILDDGLVAWAVRSYYWDSREQGDKQKTDGEYADALERFIAESPVNRTDDVQVIIDPSASSFKVELMKRGLFLIDADNEVLDGIRMTSAMLGNNLLRFHRHNCKEIVDEMTAYAWDATASEAGVEQPLKQHDHGPDAIRYFVKTRVNTWRLSQVA